MAMTPEDREALKDNSLVEVEPKLTLRLDVENVREVISVLRAFIEKIEATQVDDVPRALVRAFGYRKVIRSYRAIVRSKELVLDLVSSPEPTPEPEPNPTKVCAASKSVK